MFDLNDPLKHLMILDYTDYTSLQKKGSIFLLLSLRTQSLHYAMDF